MIYGFAACEFMRKWTGMRLFVGGGEYCDAKLPGLYAALEKAHKSMTIAAWQGHHGGPGGGLLDEGKTLSPVQLLLDREFAAGSQQYARGIDLSLDGIGMEAILEVGVGVQANYLQSEHTLRHFREALWLPAILDRSGWNGAEHEARVLAKAQEQVNALVAQYRKPEGREDQLAALRAVIDRARGHLLSGR
jgi:trimethylamine--corrinoid protein Co-methyltransferase